MLVNDKLDGMASLKEFAETIAVPFFWTDLNQKMLGMNTCAINAIGAGSEKKILGKTAFDFYREDVAQQLILDGKKVLGSGKVVRIDQSIEDMTTQEVKFFDSTLMPLYNEEGAIIGLKGMGVDITQRKQKEQDIQNQFAQFKKWMLEKDRLKREFLENFIREVNMPIDTARQNIEWLKRSLTQWQQEHKSANALSLFDYLDSMQQGVSSIAQLCDQISDFIVYESKKPDFVG